MAKDVKLPEISENITEATVIKILVSEGDEVEEEQSLIEIETDKAVSELPSPVAGKIKEIKVSEGDEVEIGSVILTIDEREESGGEKKESEKKTDEEEKETEKGIKEVETKEEDDEETAEETEVNAQEEKAGEKKEETGKEEKVDDKKTEKKKEKPLPEDSDDGKEKPVPAAPSVRRFAREIGLDIHKVEGTGPGNRILIDDVKAYAKETLSEKDTSGIGGMGIDLPDFSKWGEIEKEPLSKVRQITAENTLKSWNSSPHVTQFDKADITSLEAFRHKYTKIVEKAGGKLTVTAILLKVIAFALQQFPRFNSSLDMKNKEIIYKKYIHVGVAVDTDRGLLVPVVKDVDKKTLIDLAVELGSLAEKARNKKISPDELQGGNFVISNLGGIGGTNFTPVIFPPQVAILGISRAEMQPVYQEDGEFKPRLILPLNISYDHKVIDGADGARFLRWVCEALENPMSVFLNEKK